MSSFTTEVHAATSVSQNNQGRVLGLGRGSSSKNQLRSPNKFRSLKIIQCNINGLSTGATRTKLDQLLDLADKHDVQIIALQETKLKPRSHLKIQGYDIFRTDRGGNGGGGLAFLIRGAAYQDISITSSANSDLEVQGISIFWRNEPLNIFNMYHPPNYNKLLDCFNSIPDENSIILGDFNAKNQMWGCSEQNQRGIELQGLTDDRGFIFLNDGTPTHSSFTYGTSEALDVALVTPDLYPICNWSVLGNIGSDHRPILIEVKRKHQTSLYREKYWNFSKANWKSYATDIEKNVSKLSTPADLETEWTSFKNLIISAARKHIPRGYVKRHIPNFIHKSPLLKPLLEKRRQIELDLTTSNDSNHRVELNRINAEIKLIYADLRRKRWNDICEKMDARTPDTKLWNIARGINREQEQTVKCNTILDPNGDFTHDDRSAADLLGAFYQKTSSLDFCPQDRRVAKRARNLVHGCRTTDSNVSTFTNLFTMQELLLALASLDLTKSPGPDGIYGQMLDNLGQAGRQQLLAIFNRSWCLGRLPHDWRTATIIPFCKPGKEASSPESYRPIALTCISCKVMEKMVLTRLKYYLDLGDLLPKEQYGFKRGHCTTDQVLYFCQRVRDSQNLKPTNHTVAAFLDLSKAFDRVWKQKLIVKLHDKFKICGRALTWIYDFLRNRVIRVKYNKVFSRSFKLNQGVPQGSVLSPTLFSMFLSGAEKLVTRNCEIGLFADDIILWSSGPDIKKTEANLNSALSDLWRFAERHKLNFNPLKSNVSFFTTNRKLYNFHPQVSFGGQLLYSEKHPKYLGFVLDPEFTCNKHIESLVLKSRKRLNLLKFISGRDWGARADTLRTTYISFVRPILEYGSSIYSSASQSNLQKLERVQLSAARIITGLRNSCPNDVVLYEADLQPLSMRREANLMKYYSKLISYGTQNRTAELILKWHNNQRLKKNSPLSLAASMELIDKSVESHSLSMGIDPSIGLTEVFFHTELLSPVSKNSSVPEHLKQLALEVINGIPQDATKIYTDGSKGENNQSGSGVFIRTPRGEQRIEIRNPDHCSVFRSELIAIEAGLRAILAERSYGEVWILSDSKSSIQHLSDWSTVGDRAGVSILSMLKQLSKSRTIHLQWIPSHVDIHGNEVADCLAKGGSQAPAPFPVLTFSEAYSIRKNRTKLKWLIPPASNWYRRKSPGGSLGHTCARKDQTALSRFASGHLKTLTFQGGLKVFPICGKCATEMASPDHILDCLQLSWEDLVREPLTVVDFLRVFNLMEFV